MRFILWNKTKGFSKKNTPQALPTSCQICATRAGAIFSVLAGKISVLREKLVIICASRAGANFGVLRQQLVIICATRAGTNLGVLSCKISV